VNELLWPDEIVETGSLHPSEREGRNIRCDEQGFWRNIVDEKEGNGVRVDVGPILHTGAILFLSFVSLKTPLILSSEYSTMSRLSTRRISSTAPDHSLTLHSPSQTKRSSPSLRTRYCEPNKSPLPPSNLSGSSHSTRWNYPYTARDGRKRSTTLDPRRYLRRNSSSPTRPLSSLRLS